MNLVIHDNIKSATALRHSQTMSGRWYHNSHNRHFLKVVRGLWTQTADDESVIWTVDCDVDMSVNRVKLLHIWPTKHFARVCAWVWLMNDVMTSSFQAHVPSIFPYIFFCSTNLVILFANNNGTVRKRSFHWRHILPHDFFFPSKSLCMYLRHGRRHIA